MKRIWNVRLNVDEWNSGIAGLDDDAERIRFLAGFNAGINGKETMPKGEAWEAGWKVGNSSHLEAVKFSDQQRARALKRDYGNAGAMPGHDSGNAGAMPISTIYNLQSTIEVTNNPINQSLPPMAEAKTSKPRNFFGPEILTNTGKPWQLPLTTAKRHMVAYGYSEAELIRQLERIAKHKADLPQEKRPGFGGMHKIIESWIVQHAPSSAATEVAPRAPKLDAATLAYAMEVQAQVFPRATA